MSKRQPTRVDHVERMSKQIDYTDCDEQVRIQRRHKRVERIIERCEELAEKYGKEGA